MPLLLAIAGYLFWQQFSDIYGDKGRLVTTREDDAVVLYWHHEIEVPMVKRFSEAFRKWQDETDRFIIDLNSPGGALREGGRIIELINKMQASHEIETRVGAGNYCLSMCVPIFLAGEKRIAAANSHWMFHEPSASDFFTGEDVEIPDHERRSKADRFFEKYFVNSQMDAAWRERLRKEWVGKDVWKTGLQLVAEGSNIISELQR